MKRIILNQLDQWKAKKNRKPLILNGVRQSGKTHSLKHFAKSSFPQHHYFNFEEDPRLGALFEQDLHPERIRNALSFYRNQPIDWTQDLIIFDEIQACPLALTSLKYFHEIQPEVAIACAGSLLGVTLNTAAYPVGKVDTLPMFPLTFYEFLLAIDEERLAEVLQDQAHYSEIPSIAHQRLWEAMQWYWVVGGLPEVVATFVAEKENLFRAFEAAREKQKQLLQDYYADFAKHAGKINAMHLDRVWRSIPQQLAQTHDGNAGRFKFKGIVPGIDRYSRLAGVIDWLTAAHLVIHIPVIDNAQIPMSAYTEASSFKLYMFDVGMLGAFLDMPFQAILEGDFGTYKGYYAENFAAQALIAQGQAMYCWQKLRAEVEFVIQAGEQIVPIEVKSGHITRARSLQKFTDYYHPPLRVIASAKPFLMDQAHQLQHCPLYLIGEWCARLSVE
jgi:predicted AAA+ superfamily ATPase